MIYHLNAISQNSQTDFNIHNYLGFLQQGQGKNRHYFECPNCNHMKLSINKTSPKYECYHCHDQSAIASVLRKQENELKQKEYKPPRQKASYEWIYTDSQGNELIKVKRLDTTEGKRIYQYSKVDGKWQSGLHGISQKDCTLLYIDEVTKAIANNEPVFVVEGESCADALRALDFVATTNIGGSGKNHHSYSVLSGYENTIICPDRDIQGVKHSAKIQEVVGSAKWLYAYPQSPLWTIRLENGGGLDIADWIYELREVNKMNKKQIKEKIVEAIEDKPRQLKLGSTENKMINSSSTDQVPNQSPLSFNQAVERCREIITSDLDELQMNGQLEDVRRLAKMGEYNFNQKIVNPLMRQLKKTKLKLEIQRYNNESDIFEKIQIKQQICSNYSLNSRDFKTLSEYTEKLEATPEKTTFSLRELMEMELMEESWLIPSLLPKGEMLLLTAPAKMGKSMLGCDITYSVLTGGKILNEQSKQGKVLYISSDESLSTLTRRFQSRGFDLILETEIEKNVQIMSHLDISDLSPLEEKLEDFKPDLVIIDSLTSITTNLGIDENHSDFARQIYKLKDFLKRYNTSSILIHHENKSSEAKGISKVAGSARITAAVWGIAQLSGNPENDKSTTCFLNLTPRQGEKTTYQLNINPTQTWTEKGIFEFVLESSDPQGTKKTQGEQVISLLQAKGVPLEYTEINEYLNIGKSLYKVLDRLCDRKLISKRRSKSNPRRWVYFTKELNDNQSQQATSNKVDSTTTNSLTPLPPSNTLEIVELKDEKTEEKEVEVSGQVSGQLVDTTKPSDLQSNTSNPDTTMDEPVSGQLSPKQGRGGSEPPVESENEERDYCEKGQVNENEVGESSESENDECLPSAVKEFLDKYENLKIDSINFEEFFLDLISLPRNYQEYAHNRVDNSLRFSSQ